jgi:CheY-like chemotaxis protein
MPTVLVVDDHADVRLLMTTVLASGGYHVVEAASGDEALAMTAGPDVPDAIVLDVQMPLLDGWDTLAGIRASPRFGEVPVVLCTVKSSAADRMRGWKLGCDGYLVKPFDIDDLLREVENAMTKRAAQRLAVRRQRQAGDERRWRLAR